MKKMNEVKEMALTNFRTGYNCAESVLKAIAEAYEIDNDLIPNVATGFGGGVSRQGRDCGAVSGAVLGFGLLYGRNNTEGIRAHTYNPVVEFYKRFGEKYGSVVCRELCGCDLSTREGITKFREEHVHEKKCTDFVGGAIEIFMKLAQEKA